METFEDRKKSDRERIDSCIARMRGPMLKAHPDWMMACVSDVLECALSLEKFQEELIGLLREVETGFAHGYTDDGMDLWRRISDAIPPDEESLETSLPKE